MKNMMPAKNNEEIVFLHGAGADAQNAGYFSTSVRLAVTDPARCLQFVFTQAKIISWGGDHIS